MFLLCGAGGGSDENTSACLSRGRGASICMGWFLVDNWRISSHGCGSTVGRRIARQRHFPCYIVGCSSVWCIFLLLGGMIA